MKHCIATGRFECILMMLVLVGLTANTLAFISNLSSSLNGQQLQQMSAGFTCGQILVAEGITCTRRSSVFSMQPRGFESCTGSKNENRGKSRPGNEYAVRKNDHKGEEVALNSANRRHILEGSSALIMSLFGTLTTAAAIPSPAFAKGNDDLFRPNPLTNPILEQIRIWDQNQANTLKYGGELERGEAEKQILRNNRSTDITSSRQYKETYYARLLVPILVIVDEIEEVNQLIQQTRSVPAGDKTFSVLQQAQQILSQTKYDTLEFKKIFNAFGDNIYYTDPDRANLYLGGGATPKSSQSMAYLLRNDILTNIQDMRDELSYLLSFSAPKSRNEDPSTSPPNTEDLIQMAEAAHRAMKQYVNEVVPPNEIEAARSIIKTETK